MKPLVLGSVAGLLLAVCSAQVSAQPLAEIARREKLRRAALAEKAAAKQTAPKTYTEADLRGAGGRLTTSDGDPLLPAAGVTATDPASTTEDAPEPANEDQWRSRISAVEQARDRAQLMVAALQNRVDGLWAEFTGRDDPAQRAVIEANRQAALEEIDNTSAEVQELTQQIADIREEARRANVPPGWLR